MIVSSRSTSTRLAAVPGLNLNVNNEVIASKALENHQVGMHPLDDVNMSQSSNDVVPTAIRLASARVAREVG